MTAGQMPMLLTKLDKGLAPLGWMVVMKIFFIFLGLYSPLPNLSELWDSGISTLAFTRLLALH